MRTLYKIIRWAAVLGFTASACFLSFGGVFALPLTSAFFLLAQPDVIAKLSAFFAAAIEGTVNQQNAVAALDFSLQHSIAKRLLHKLNTTILLPHNGHSHDAHIPCSGEHKNAAHNTFLDDYINQKNYLHELEENLDHFEEEKIAEREIIVVKKRLEMMETLFLNKVLHKEQKNSDAQNLFIEIDKLLLIKDNQSNFIVDSQKIQDEIKRKEAELFLSKIASIGAGICCSLVTLGSLHSNIIAIGYQWTSIALIGGSVISGLAGIGYLLLMYRTLSYLIQSEAAKKWCKKAKDFYTQENKTGWDYLKVFAMGLFITISVVGTISIIGTWLCLGASGASLTFFPPVIAKCLNLLSWVCMCVPTFLYNVLNTIKSLYTFPDLFRTFCKKANADMRDALKNENLLQLLNPFRMLMKASKIVIFIGHILSTGFSSANDKNPFISSTEVAIVANAINEGTVDAHQIASHTHNDEEEEEEDDHHHGGIILDQVEWLLKKLTIGFDFLAGNVLGIRNIANYFLGGYPAYTLKEAIHKFSPVKSLPKPHPLSEKWAKYEIREQLQEQITYYGKKNVENKKQDFFTLNENLEKSEVADFIDMLEQALQGKTKELNRVMKKPNSSKQKTNPENLSLEEKTPISVEKFSLFCHRHSFRTQSSNPPRSQQIIQDITLDPSFPKLDMPLLSTRGQ
ncbi:MAG: hypothetical protein K0S27_1300 [Gammaproteobacteria bacterium]|jgi:hypothetical protein|nr:hypothetical protein [Gammaproteobacteria bacterium]